MSHKASPKTDQKPGQKWVLHKFGGTSVASAERYLAVAGIIRGNAAAPQAIVVSAMGKVTDALIELTELAAKRDEAYVAKLDALEEKHLKTAAELIPGDAHQPLAQRIEADFRDLREILRGVWQVKSCSLQNVELVSGYGELWSAQLLNAHLNASGTKSKWLDARAVLVVESGECSVTIDWEESQERVNQWLKENLTPKGDHELLVLTGFIASTRDGIATTLKRNGSDYSASIFGALLDASEINIWTDVDGVLSADPRLVPDAVILPELSYEEATELAYFGAKVVHPSTMGPAIRKGIPIWIKNTFKPRLPGSRIHRKARSEHPVKGFASIDGMALVNIEGTGMVGVPGTAERIFGALKEAGISVVLISQASSEHSICFAVSEEHAASAKKTVEKAFFAELHEGIIQSVAVTPNCSILAAVGDGMVHSPGISGRFFTALGNAGVNIRAIAQGASERNISAVVDTPDARRALRAVHSAFYLSSYPLSIGIIGPGLIGGTLLEQFARQAGRLRAERKIDLRVRGIANSKKMLLSETGVDLAGWRKEFERATSATDLEEFVRHVHAKHLPHAVLVDTTASYETAKLYPQWLERGIHVITPNKKAGTAAYEFYRRLRNLSRASGRHYLYDTTVGAGLPLLHSLRELLQTGDEVLRIEGILSGTLSYIFNTFDGTKPFSDIVKAARASGYTEPDPRDDLSGQDVARKLVILAREMGLGLELSDVKVKSLVPEPLRAGSVEDFLKGLPAFDGAMKTLFDGAFGAGECLRFVGAVTPDGRASVDLQRYPRTHAFARVSGSDNIVLFRTSRYDKQPLIIQGPGAGPDVTAAGVFANILRLASYLGAPS